MIDLTILVPSYGTYFFASSPAFSWTRPGLVEAFLRRPPFRLRGPHFFGRLGFRQQGSWQTLVAVVAGAADGMGPAGFRHFGKVGRNVGKTSRLPDLGCLGGQ